MMREEYSSLPVAFVRGMFEVGFSGVQRSANEANWLVWLL